MALIKCSECGHTISDKAKKCPECGCPIEGKSTTKKRNHIIGLSILCILAIAVCAWLVVQTHLKKERNAHVTPSQVTAVQKDIGLQNFHEGYVDLDGNDTFTNQEKQVEKAAAAVEREKARIEAQRKWQEEQQRQAVEAMRERNNQKVDQLLPLESKIKSAHQKVESAYRSYKNMYASTGLSMATAPYIFDLRDAVENEKRLYQQCLRIANEMEGEQGQKMVASYQNKIQKCNNFLSEINGLLNRR